MDLIGKVIKDRYEIEELIGSGGMARVYKAKCRQLNRYVAIKVLRDELKEDTEFVDKFKTEALAAASLTHPNIVSVFDSGEEDGIYFFVMEYVDGYTLKQYISRKGALEWREACNITLGICSAIEQAHKNSIVHRDIKPHNIMLNSDGVVKVTDFGIAKAVSSSTIVRGGNIIGSVHYFSPEQARGAATTFKSDIYSIGVVFYELLVGRVPFDADDPFNVAKMQVEQMPIEPKRMNESIPKTINMVVMRALSKKPEERYNNVGDMISGIKNAISLADTIGDGDFDNLPTENFDDTAEVPVVIDVKENEENTGNKKNRLSVILGVAIGIVIILAAALSQILPNISRTEIITVEDFVGKDFETIVEEYQNSDIYEFVIEKEEYDDTYAVGEIIKHSPSFSKQYSDEDLPITIKCIVSKGGGVKMPDYKGKEAALIEYELLLDGYKVELKERPSEDVPEGMVVMTIPEKGDIIEEDDKIILYVSTGPEETELEDPNNNESTENNPPDNPVTPPDNPVNPQPIEPNPYEGL